MDTALYDRYAHLIFAYARLHLSSREDAEDLTLEVFLAALERNNLAGLSEEEQLQWLRRVARNKLVDSYRRDSRHPSIALDGLAETLYAEEGQSPEACALRKERHQQLHAAVRRLSPLQQHVLQLRYAHGLRFAEIALLLGKQEAALRKQLSRALVSLRSSYESQQEKR